MGPCRLLKTIFAQFLGKYRVVSALFGKIERLTFTGTFDAFQHLVKSHSFKQICFPHRSEMGVLKSFPYAVYGSVRTVVWKEAWEVIPCLLSDFRRHPGRFRASCGSDASLYAPIGRVLGKTRNRLASPLSWAGTGRRPSLEGLGLRRRRIEAF